MTNKFEDFSKKLENVKVYKASSKEQLKAKFNNNFTIDADVKPVAQFSSDNLKLPLRVRGELLRPGQYYTGQITEDELRKAFQDLVNNKKELMMFTTHDAYWGESSNVNDVAGKLFNFDWDNQNKSIQFEGDIYDEGTALKVLNNVVKGISAGFEYNNVGGLNKNIEINEGTLTFKPHCKTAQIQPVS